MIIRWNLPYLSNEIIRTRFLISIFYYWFGTLFTFYIRCFLCFPAFSAFPSWNEVCHDGLTDKNFALEGKSIKVFGYHTRLRSFNYLGLSFTNLWFKTSAYCFLIWQFGRLHDTLGSVLDKRSYYFRCKFENFQHNIAPEHAWIYE